jgi:threonine/homoserine/homoserine lactone efflux protein
MSYLQNLSVYFALLFGIILVPGLDMTFVLANALAGGRRAGLAATAGVMAGGAVMTLIGALAAAGLAQALPMLAAPMLIVGSAYMGWIGFSLARSSITAERVEGARPARLGVLAGQGLATCVLNPKAWMFTLAVTPQFLRADYGALGPQAVALGAMTMATQGLIYGALALAAGQARATLIERPAVTIWIGRGAGWLLIAMAVFGLWRGLAFL